MAEEYYSIPEAPEYHENIRKLQDSDPASASGTFNPLLQQIVENVAAVKEQAESKQDQLTGTQGQVVGFDADGNAVAQEAPDTGVTSFNGRSGEVKPQASDYTAAAVGAATPAEVEAVSTVATAASTLAASVNNAIQATALALGRSAAASGNNSTALGYRVTANGIGSTALGYSATANGSSSTALGSRATASGSSSTALGYSAAASGNNSTALGYSTAASGNNSTALGPYTKASADYSTALGYYAVTSNVNSIQLGNASTLSAITAKVAITVTSDERDKADITPVGNGAVEFLRKIKAVRYVWNGREMYIDEDNLSDADRENKMKYGLCAYDREAHAKGTKKGSRVRIGVLAQEIQAAMQEVYGSTSYANLVNDNLFDFDPAEFPEGVENQLAVNYEGFIPFLIKAVQELDARLKIAEGV